MEKRLDVSHSELERIQAKLKNKGYSIRDINEKIDADFRNYLHKEHSMPKAAFDKLCSLLESEINANEICFVNGKGEIEEKNFCQDKKLAELVGIILGDGHIHSSKDVNRSGNYISVTLNENEEKLIEKTVKLFNNFFQKSSTYDSKTAKSIQVRSYGIENVNFLRDNGLKSGNKVDQQVKVPKWIFEERRFMISALRGLIDTDGTIYRRNHDDYVVIQFRNRSLPLLEDFDNMCEILGVTCSNGGKYDVQIASQNEVIKFLDINETIKSQRVERPIKD